MGDSRSGGVKHVRLEPSSKTWVLRFSIFDMHLDKFWGGGEEHSEERRERVRDQGSMSPHAIPLNERRAQQWRSMRGEIKCLFPPQVSSPVPHWVSHMDICDLCLKTQCTFFPYNMTLRILCIHSKKLSVLSLEEKNKVLLDFWGVMPPSWEIFNGSFT